MTDSAEGSGLFRNIAIAVVTGMVTYAGTLYFNAPQEGSPNYLLMERLGVVEKEPPALDCPGFRQDIPYSEARELLKDCGWYAVITPPLKIDSFTSRDVAVNQGWLEVQNCQGTGLGFCDFLFIKSEGARLSVGTAGMNHIVVGYRTYWEPETR